MTIEMAQTTLQHAPAYVLGLMGTVGGVVASASGETSIADIGAAAGVASFGGLVYFIVRDLAPKALDTIPLWLSNRAANIRNEEAIKHANEQLASLRAENAKLRADLEATDARADASAIAATLAKADADHAKALASEAKVQADVLKERLRETGHAVRNNSQDILNLKEAAATGSADRDPESAT